MFALQLMPHTRPKKIIWLFLLVQVFLCRCDKKTNVSRQCNNGRHVACPCFFVHMFWSEWLPSTHLICLELLSDNSDVLLVLRMDVLLLLPVSQKHMWAKAEPASCMAWSLWGVHTCRAAWGGHTGTWHWPQQQTTPGCWHLQWGCPHLGSGSPHSGCPPLPTITAQDTAEQPQSAPSGQLLLSWFHTE